MDKEQQTIERLREYAEWARANEWEVPITLADDLEVAAKRVEEAEHENVDAVPVRHSYWESHTTSQFMGYDNFGEPRYRDGRVFFCHECIYRTAIRSNYCPNCGAKMDEEETT